METQVRTQALPNQLTGEQNNMAGDDSHLVDEILNELNEGTDVNNQQATPNVDPHLQTDPQMSMDQQAPMNSMEQPNMMQQPNMMHPQMQMNIEEKQQELPEMMNIEYDADDSQISKIMHSLKKPLIIALLAFIVFNPLVLNLLRNYLPRVFGETENILKRQGRTLILAVLVGILYFCSNMLM